MGKPSMGFWEKIALLALVGVVIYGCGYLYLISSGSNTLKTDFNQNYYSPNIRNFDLTDDGFLIDYEAVGGNFSTSERNSYPVEKLRKDRSGLDKLKAQKHDGYFYNTVFDNKSGIMKITEGVIVREKVYFCEYKVNCRDIDALYSTVDYARDNNTVFVTYTPSIKKYTVAFSIICCIILFIFAFSCGEASCGCQ